MEKECHFVMCPMEGRGGERWGDGGGGERERERERSERAKGRKK